MKSLTTIFATIFLLSCTNQNEKNVSKSENEKLIKQYFEYFNKHDWKKMSEMYVPVSDFKDPSLGQGIVKQSRKQILEKYSALNELFPDLKDEIISIYPSGDKNVIVEFISSGTAPDGSKFQLPICTIFTIENGKITKDFTYYDNFEEPTEE
jgi:ketosteroid isomerase-like protein